MATFLRNKVVTNIGTTPVDAIQTTSGNRFAVIGCNLANTTDGIVVVNIWIVDETSTAGYWVRDLSIPPYTSAKVITNGEKLVLAPNYFLRIGSNTANSIDAVISYAEIV
jgi:hypothetical protein